MQKKTQNKRKLHCLVLGILTGVFAMGSMGCQKDEAVGQGTSGKTEVLLHGFESIDELYSMDGINRFGRISLNQDTDLVTEGNASAKLEVYGDYKAGTSNPALQVMVNNDNGYAYPDFSCVKAITFDLYSENQEEQNIEISLTFADESESSATTKYQEFTISNGWNSIVYAVDGSLLSISHDMKKMSSVNIRFEKVLDMDAEPFLYYMDNMQLSLKQVEWEPVELVQEENELCSFDSDVQVNLVQAGCIGPGEPYAPVLSLNQDLLYCKNYEGASLKVEMPAGTKVNNSWPLFQFDMSFFENYNLTEMALEGKELVFDVYNIGSAYNLAIEYSAVHDGKTVAQGGVPITANGGWTEIRFPLRTLYECVGDLDGEEVHLSDSGVMTLFRISWCEFVGDDKIMYFDNFRFE